MQGANPCPFPTAKDIKKLNNMSNQRIKEKKMKEVKFKNKKLVQDGDALHTFYGKANDLQSYAVIDDGKVWRFNEEIGNEKDIKIIGRVSEKQLEKYKEKTRDSSFNKLENETIVSFKEVEPPFGFWGDVIVRYEIKTKSGKRYWMTTEGGTNLSLSGFPGSQHHGVYLEEILNKPKNKL